MTAGEMRLRDGAVAAISASHDHDHGHSHPHEVPHLHLHQIEAAPSVGHAARPTVPSQAVLVNVGEHTGALILSAPAEREGLEVEIHPISQPSKRTHVWVLPRVGRGGTVYAAVFPSLPADDYAVIGLDGSITQVVPVPANKVTSAAWA
jgi:hypothetical protein